MQLKPVFTLLALALAAQASTVANVLSDIATLSADVTTLNNNINAFPNTGGSLTAALAIHTDANNFITAVTQATTDFNNVTPLPVSEADGTSIINGINALKPTMLAALAEIVAKKAAFTALPVGGVPALVKADINAMNTARSAFEAALLANVPADLKAAASSIQSTCNVAFATAIAAYANV